MNKKLALALAAIVLLAGGMYYALAVYKSPEQISIEKQEIEDSIVRDTSVLKTIEEYLKIRETGEDPEGKTSRLQDAIIQSGEGLITAAKDSFVDFDRQAGALRTIVSMRIKEFEKKREE